MNTTPCPTCGRPAIRRAFATTALYATCAVGHVFAAATTTEERDTIAGLPRESTEVLAAARTAIEGMQR